MKITKWALAVGAFAAGAILAGTLATAATAADSAGPTARADVACETEDSTACLWDAAARGDGRGTSVYNDADGRHYFQAPTREAFTAAKRAEGWTWLGMRDGHANCWAFVAETSVLHCYDGFVTTS